MFKELCVGKRTKAKYVFLTNHNITVALLIDDLRYGDQGKKDKGRSMVLQL